MAPVFPFEIVLDPAGSRQLALRDALRRAILDGRLPHGSALPASRQAASSLGLSRNTVVAAYDLLLAEGYLQARTKARPIVSGPPQMAAPTTAAPLAARLIQPIWQQQTVQAATPGNGSFRLGMPEQRYFPHDVWRRLSARAQRHWEKTGFSYPPVEGIASLREAIAQHAAQTRGVACRPSDVLVSCGAQQAFTLLARMLVKPGETEVAVEDPGYGPLRQALLAAGARLRPVPVDAHGMQIEHLPAQARIICVTPSHQSPMGVVLSMARRHALLDWARQHGAVVIEDDYDGEFRFGKRPLDALQTLDRSGQVFYVGTFSKTLFPSLRLGYIIAPPWAQNALRAVKRSDDGHTELHSQLVLADFIRAGHMARHVRRMQAVYAKRRSVLLEILARDFDEVFTILPSEAGLHLATLLRDPASAAAVTAAALQHTPGVEPHAANAIGSVAPGLAFGYGVIDVASMRRQLSQLRLALETNGV
ncbi:PLP-dependent aminotransferase family protein [Massilia sp. TS11]|uniref:MocR-like pyridoxine biosynthesis transcription factor PdxR n=1 Tax=Massilia sp. TS11 TaxID=2908003 RepID=UPI001EDC9234|nr:PLP-dependent aminotransferase family protein [Massilia sp. TS11]MCG2584078.1 PLP-dependent aminotransferase family protein [Massilia sp. TS11]